MDLNYFQEEVQKSRVIAEENKIRYERISTFSTLMAVLAPILIAQVWNFYVRILGACLMLLNWGIMFKMDDAFSNWLGYLKRHNLLKLEFFKFQTGLEDYEGLDEILKFETLQKRFENLYKETTAIMTILQLDLTQLQKEILVQQTIIDEINNKMNEIVEYIGKEDKNITQERFEYYVKYRYLDQFNWYYKRIKASKEGLREKDIKKSVYFNFKKHFWVSTSLKFVSFGLTIFTGEMILKLLGVIKTSEMSVILVLIATVASIISSMYSEIDKIQKNRENTITYFLTIKNLERIYSEFVTDYAPDLDLDALRKIQKLFVEKSEQAFLQENVKWKEIQSSKTSS